MRLESEAARQALDAVEGRAAATAVADMARLSTALGRAISTADVESFVDKIRHNCRLTLNFHPDRRTRDGVTVSEGLLTTGRYRPQIETGLSNGGRSAVPGGDRTAWERHLFGPVYDDPSAIHPVYGSLDVARDPHGGSPRFGSCFVVLHEHCVDRATLCVGDSHVGPTDVGTARAAIAVLAGLFEHAATGEGLGRAMSTHDLHRALDGTPAAATPARDLDHYVEAQVHGEVSLHHDVAAIVLDPSFRSTDVEAHLVAAAERYEFEISWHRGSALDAEKFPGDFRGPEMPALASAVSHPSGLVDAAAIGTALRLVRYTPPTAEGDPPEGALQQHKYLWHCLLALGHDHPAA